MKKPSLRERIEARIAANKAASVFLTREFTDLGGASQLSRALRELVEEGRLLRLGRGVYGRATISSLSGKTMLDSPDSFAGASREALTKLAVAWEPTWLERAYAEGRSVQVPVNAVVCVRGRQRRKLAYNGRELVYERVSSQPAGPAETRSAATIATAPIAVREALLLLLEADKYPCIGNEDWAVAAQMGKDALAKAATAIASPDDPPEFGRWLEVLRLPDLSADAREEVLFAMYDYFEYGDVP